MYILTHQSLLTSANLLAKEIEALSGIHLDVSLNARREPPTIRWGSSRGSYERDTSYNSPRAIRICGSKFAFSNFLSTLNIPFIEINSGYPERFPVVVRKSLNSSGGNGIIICKNIDEFSQYKNYYWSYFCRFRYELGVHILDGNVVKVFKKVWSGTSDEPVFPIRNLERGYSFKRVDPTNFEKLHPYVEKICKELMIGFCRADIGWDDIEKCYKAIEFNSAPSLSNNEDTLNMYAEFLLERGL